MLSVVMLLTDSPASAKDSTEMRTEFGPIAVVAEVPAFCVINNGPSTADAVCDPDGDGEAVRNTSVSTSLYFEITVQAFAGHQSPLALAQAYTFADFQKDLPGAICGEERLSRVRVEQPQRQMGETTVTYSATVTCPEVKFLSLGRRRALVRYIVTDGVRVNTMARTLAGNFDRNKALLDAFHASVRLQREK